MLYNAVIRPNHIMTVHSDSEIQQLPLHDLVPYCQTETDKFFRDESYDSRYGHELFRRALALQKDEAWDALYTHYSPLVGGWALQHSLFHRLGLEVDEIINLAFIKLSNSITPAKFDNFATLAALLNYLKMGVHSVLCDRWRMLQSRPDTTEIDDGMENRWGGTSLSTDAVYQFNATQKELWQLILGQLKSEEEKVVMVCLFSIGMKPREIAKRYPDLFVDSKAVSRVKENVIDRFRRDADLQDLLRQL